MTDRWLVRSSAVVLGATIPLLLLPLGIVLDNDTVFEIGLLGAATGAFLGALAGPWAAGSGSLVLHTLALGAVAPVVGAGVLVTWWGMTSAAQGGSPMERLAAWFVVAILVGAYALLLTLPLMLVTWPTALAAVALLRLVFRGPDRRAVTVLAIAITISVVVVAGSAWYVILAGPPG